MAGEALLYRSNTCVILIDEPQTDQLDRSTLDDDLEAGAALAAAGKLPILDFRQTATADAPFLADEALLDRIAEVGRNSLVLCGGLLEGAVTQVALAALMSGLDVFVAADLVVSAEPEKSSLFLSRITACGGHVLSHRQIVLELLSGLRDESQRKPLEALLISPLG